LTDAAFARIAHVRARPRPRPRETDETRAYDASPSTTPRTRARIEVTTAMTSRPLLDIPTDDDDDVDDAPSTSTSRAVVQEIRAHVAYALPVTTSSLCNRARDLISLAFVGAEASTTTLAGAAVASTVANVTGNAVLVGLTSALLTLAGQAYGAKKYGEVAAWTQRAAVVMFCAAACVAAGWTKIDRALVFLGQDAAISSAAKAYIRGLTPGLFAYAGNACAQAFLQSQGVTRPQAVSGVAATMLHTPWCAAFKAMGFGFVGPAYATSVSTSSVLVWNCLFVRLRRRPNGAFREGDENVARKRDACWRGFSRETMFNRAGLVAFLALGVPGVLTMAEWWASEALIVLAGYLPQPEVTVSAMSIYQATTAFAFMIAVGFGAATATRVSHEVGARNARGASLAASVALCLVVGGELVVSLVVYLLRDHWGAAFTSDARVRALVSKLMLPLAVYVFFDAICCVSTSVLRGAGRQAFAAPIILVAYYLVGLPTSAYLAFTKSRGVVGLAVGGVLGTAAHAAAMTFVAVRVDWRREIERSLDIRRVRAADADDSDSGSDDADDDADDDTAYDHTDDDTRKLLAA